jgi:hypothetical protein
VDVIVQRDYGRGTAVKGNDDDGWSFDDVVLWLGRRQNRDSCVVERVTNVEITFL